MKSFSLQFIIHHPSLHPVIPQAAVVSRCEDTHTHTRTGVHMPQGRLGLSVRLVFMVLEKLEPTPTLANCIQPSIQLETELTNVCAVKVAGMNESCFSEDLIEDGVCISVVPLAVKGLRSSFTLCPTATPPSPTPCGEGWLSSDCFGLGLKKPKRFNSKPQRCYLRRNLPPFPPS